MQKNQINLMTSGSEKRYSDTNLIDYVVCPAKALINICTQNVPDRRKVRNRLRPALNEISIPLLNGDVLENSEDHINNVIYNLFEDLEYNKKEKDLKAVTEMFSNYIYMIDHNEFQIDQLAHPFETSYDGILLSSQIDLIVMNKKTGIKHPTIVDFSNTRYASYFNPIIYRCQMVTDYMKSKNTNTNVLILSICSGRPWYFDKKRYDNILFVSICELLEGMNKDLFPCRFGWWCEGCDFRGICHLLIKINK